VAAGTAPIVGVVDWLRAETGVVRAALGVEAGIHGICLPQQYLAYRD
jgi:hypothetical protein